MKPPRSTSVKQDFHADIEAIVKVLAGNVSFGSTNNTDLEQNIDCWKASGTTPGVADTEFTVTHSLGRVPMGYIVISVDKAAVIYKGATTWTATTVYLKCNVATVAYRLILV